MAGHILRTSPAFYLWSLAGRTAFCLSRSMALQRTFQGLETELRSRGGGRFGSAAFLTLWLLFWVVGEAFALGILGRGAWALVTGQPPGAGHAPLEVAPALATGLFLIFWTAFWTLGGVLAGHEWLRLLFGRDRLIARSDGLEIVRSYGLFRSRQRIATSDLVRFYLPYPARSGLAVETERGVETLTRFGEPAELEEIARAFNAEFMLDTAPRATGTLPRGWRLLSAPEGHDILVTDPVNRRRLGIALWIIFAPLALVSTYLILAATSQPTLTAFAVIGSAFAALAGWGAWRVSTQRDEWVPSSRGIALNRRRHNRANRVFTGDALEVREDRDSDGDASFSLLAVQTISREQATLQHARKFERAIASCTGDPSEMLAFGRWLAHHTQLPLTDRTTAAAKAADFEQLRGKLAATGRFGQWAANVLGKVGPRVR